MSKSHQVIRIFLLLIFPIIVGLSAYAMYANCRYDYAPDAPRPCGFPFTHTVHHPGFPEAGIHGWEETNYLGIAADILFWLIPIVVWASVFRRYGLSANR